MILVINCGSTSVKYEVFDDDLSVGEGEITGIAKDESELRHETESATVERTAVVANHDDALENAIHTITHSKHGIVDSIDEITAVGHRVVHGGELSEPQLVDKAVKETIRDFATIAPLHNPVNLAGIEAAQRLIPNNPHVAVFDTAFHQSLPEKAYRYGLPLKFFEDYGIRKFGFHGISHEFVAIETADLLGVAFDEANLITCHLGGGCSLAAVRGGESVETSMGFSPLEGLIMATRTGDIDPTVAQFLVDEHGYTLEEVIDVFNHESGLAGLSGRGEDLREILAARADGDKRATLAVDAFVHRIKKYIGAYGAILPSIDGIVFTAGIGENAALIRKQACDLPTLGISIDNRENESTQSETGVISTTDSNVPVVVIPTDEERMIANETERIAAVSA